MESESLVDADNGHTSNDYHAVEDAGVHGPKYTQKTVLGKVRNWKRFNWLEWIFVAIASLSILGILGMSIERFVNFERHFLNITHNSKSYICNDWVCTNDFIFTVVLVLNTVFSAAYVVDGLLRERMYALVAYSATIVVIMIYVVANYTFKSEEKQRLNTLRLVRLILVVIGGPVNIVLSSLISYKMGFFIFTTIGSNTTLIRAYKIRSFFVMLQWLLLQVMVNLLALSWSRDGHFIKVAEEVIVCLLLVHCVVVILLGIYAVMSEKHWLVPVWYFAMTPYFAYFVYKLVNVSVKFEEDFATKVTIYEPKATHVTFKYIGGAIIAACALGLVIMALTYVFMALALRNFRLGLKEKVPLPIEEWRDLWHRLAHKMGRKPSPSPLP